jgi:DNA polymerase-4
VEETFEKDLKSFEECRRRLVSLYDDFLERLEKGAYQNMIRGFVVKVKFYDFQQTTHESRGRHIPQLTDFQTLLEKAWQRRGEPVRLIGIGVRLSPEDGTQDRARHSSSIEDANSGQLSFLDLDL